MLSEFQPYPTFGYVTAEKKTCEISPERYSKCIHGKYRDVSKNRYSDALIHLQYQFVTKVIYEVQNDLSPSYFSSYLSLLFVLKTFHVLLRNSSGTVQNVTFFI